MVRTAGVVEEMRVVNLVSVVGNVVPPVGTVVNWVARVVGRVVKTAEGDTSRDVEVGEKSASVLGPTSMNEDAVEVDVNIAVARLFG